MLPLPVTLRTEGPESENGVAAGRKVKEKRLWSNLMAKSKRSKTSSGVYRTRESHLGKTPEAREHQLANLKLRWGKPVQGTIRGTSQGVASDRWTKKKLQEADIIEFATDCLGLSFAERPAQEVVLRALYGLPMTPEQVEIYRQLTGNDEVFEDGIEKTEAVLAVGARGGKSLLASIIALYESICRGHIWRKYLSPGEIGYAVITATREKQAQAIIQATCSRLLENSKVAYMLESSLQLELKLRNGLCIASFPCNSTAGRGLPIFLLVFDELAHYRVEGVNQDEKIYSALNPRRAQFRGAKCLKISTPAGKQGLFWDEFNEGFQVPGRLTVQGSTSLVNPLISEDFIKSEHRRNPDNARCEFGAEFAEKVDAYFPYDRLMECFVLDGDIPYDSRIRYFCGLDQSGLAGRDRFALCISHLADDDKVFVDAVRAWQTVDADLIMREIKEITGIYKVPTVSVDRYAVGWVRQALEKIGLEVQVRELLPTIYSNLKSLVIAGRVALPNNKSLRDGLVRTMAFYGRSNQLSISHERSSEGHADLADAVATAVFACSNRFLPAEFLAMFKGERRFSVS